MTGKLYAIGDIHGCFEKLTALMDLIKLNPKHDSIVFLGDYVDRGPSSFDVIEYLIHIQSTCEKAVFLKGNHEEMLGDFMKGRERMTFLMNGGEQTVKNYLEKTSRPYASPFPEEHLSFFQSLLPYYETDNYIFVHAGLKAGKPLNRQSPQDLFWSRNQFIRSDHDFGKIVVFGHTPFPEPYVSRNKIGIDTGAVYGNKLTGVELNEMKFFSV